MASHELIQSGYAEKMRNSFRHFFFEAWKQMSMPEELVWNWHLGVICDHLQHLFFGWTAKEEQIINNLLINVPPGSAKTAIVSIAFPAWCWTIEPRTQFLTLAANPRRSMESASLSRMLINSQWYKETFKPNWTMTEDSDTKGYFRNTRGGKRISIGMTAAVTGDRGDFILVDDPIDAKDSNSQNAIEKVNHDYDQAIANRVNDPKRSCRVGIMQRLAEEDFSDHVMGHGWTRLCIQQAMEQRCTTPWWTDPRKPGELMFPARFPQNVLDKEKVTLGGAGYSAQHQQSPTNAEGNLFRKTWFQYYTEEAEAYVLHDKKLGIRLIFKKDCQKILVADTASSTKQAADFSVIMTLIVAKDCTVLVEDVARFKSENPDVEARMLAIYQNVRPSFLAVEEKNAGIALLQSLRRQPIVVKALKAIGDKRSRSLQARIAMENGKWFFRRGATWIRDLEDELLSFDKGRHDDQVDVVAYGQLEAENIALGDPSGYLPFSILDPDRSQASLSHPKAKPPEDFKPTEMTGGVSIEGRQTAAPQRTNYQSLITNDDAWH